MKSVKQLLEESNDHEDAIKFASEYADRYDLDAHCTPVSLAKMLVFYKKQFIDTEWYNAGIMAQRILSKDEIETLKKKLKQEEFNHMNTRVSWDSTTNERDTLEYKCKALEERIKILLTT